MSHTPGPWTLWRGPKYVGGGEDICIGQGVKWIANMDHRTPRCPQVMENGHHDEAACDICSIDSACITDEQLANATLIAAAPELLAACREGLARIESDIENQNRKCSEGDLLRAAIDKATKLIEFDKRSQENPGEK